MNILYLAGMSERHCISRSDRRYRHIIRVLRKKDGDTLEAGRSDGTTGTARIERIDADGIEITYEAMREAAPLRPLHLLMGFPRPIQAGRLLKDLCSLGVSSIDFVLSELGEKSYAESDFFRKAEFDAYLVEGAEQSGNPRFPMISMYRSLDKALSAESAGDPERIARILLHPDQEAPALGSARISPPLRLAIGSERGWTASEIARLEEAGFESRSMGDRILKTETASLAAVSIVLALFGYM